MGKDYYYYVLRGLQPVLSPALSLIVLTGSAAMCGNLVAPERDFQSVSKRHPLSI